MSALRAIVSDFNRFLRSRLFWSGNRLVAAGFDLDIAKEHVDVRRVRRAGRGFAELVARFKQQAEPLIDFSEQRERVRVARWKSGHKRGPRRRVFVAERGEFGVIESGGD